MRWLALGFFLTACTAKIDGVWLGRHESALERGFVETLSLGADGNFVRLAQYSDAFDCGHEETSSGTYEWIGPMRLRFFVSDGQRRKQCTGEMTREDEDEPIASDTIDCNVTPREDRLFLDCGAKGWSNRCYQRSMPGEDCTPKATDR